MKIIHHISIYHLGDNTSEDNRRYADAVLAEIEKEYPESEVEVILTRELYSNETIVEGDDTFEVADNVNLIANEVWNRADY